MRAAFGSLLPRLACLARLACAIVGLAALGGCDRGKTEEPAAPPKAAPAPPRVVELPPALTRPAPKVVVAIGDLHGDLAQTERALRLAGAIDDKGSWIGGALTVVQTGDEIDRGDGDREILDLFERLKVEAKRAGGEVLPLLGNHELMNAAHDFRYVTPGGFAEFASVPLADGGSDDPGLASEARGRAHAFSPGGSYGRLLAGRLLFVKVGDSLFVHGGILPKHVSYGLGKMNDEVDAWLRGERPRLPSVVEAEDGPLWTRDYSREDGAPACDALGRVLQATGTKRMVVGHTPQSRGITSACDKRVWRIDTGMSRAYHGPVEVLRLEGDQVHAVRAPSP